MLADFLGLIERPLVVGFGAVNNGGRVLAVRSDGDNGKYDANHADHDACVAAEGIGGIMSMRGVNFYFCHGDFLL